MSDDNFTGNELEKTNYDDSEYIFSWDYSNPLIKPNLYSCATCNSSYNYDDDENKKKHNSCGYKVKTNGYPDMTYNDDYSSPNTYMQEKYPVEYREEYPVEYRDEYPVEYPVEYMEEYPEDVTEHMTYFQNQSYGSGGIISYSSSHLCLILIAFWVAHSNGDLQRSSGAVISIVLCIIFFPVFYLLFACFEAITKN